MIRRRLLTIAVTSLLAAGALLAQPAPASNARDMFFAGLEAETNEKGRAGARLEAPKKSVKDRPAPNRPGSRIEVSVDPQPMAAQSNLGLQYSVLKSSGLNKIEVSPRTPFRSGDRIQLKVRVNSSGYLYLVNQGTSGAWSLMYPAPKTERDANRVVAGKEYLVPDALLRFDAKPGTEKLFLIVSRERETTLDKLIYAKREGTRQAAESDLLAADLRIDDAVISRLRNAYSREFVREILEERASSAVDQAMYVVNASPRPDARVVVDISLVHR